MAKTKKRSEAASRPESNETLASGANGRTSSQAVADAEDARDRIAVRAYELYLARGGAEGGAFDDWIAAERELIGSNPQARTDRGE
jgi:Protein of unknown function (DUF2934)